MYAVIETGSKQYRVAPGDLVEVERLAGEAGASVTLDRVLLVAGDGKPSIGQPTVPQATVAAEVVKQIRGDKVIAWKMKRRKGFRKKIGHRQELTVLKINTINA